MTPISYFKQNNIKMSQVFVSKKGDAPFWKAEDGLTYTSCNSNRYGCVGVAVDKNKPIHKIPFLSQFSIKKMVSGRYCSIAVCNDGSVYSTGTGHHFGENGLGTLGVDNKSWKRIECLKDIIDCDFGDCDYGFRFVIFLSSSGRIFSAGVNVHGQLGLNTKEERNDDIMRDPTEIEYFAGFPSSKYIKAMTDKLKCSTPLPDPIIDIIIRHLPPVVPIQTIRCYYGGVLALDCTGTVYQWGERLTGGSDILCPHEINLAEKIVSIEAGSWHCICRTETGHFISIGRENAGGYGECCRDNAGDKSPQKINGWISNRINLKGTKVLSVIPGGSCTFILVSNANADDLVSNVCLIT
eukprot:358007_1